MPAITSIFNMAGMPLDHVKCQKAEGCGSQKGRGRWSHVADRDPVSVKQKARKGVGAKSNIQNSAAFRLANTNDRKVQVFFKYALPEQHI